MREKNIQILESENKWNNYKKSACNITQNNNVPVASHVALILSSHTFMKKPGKKYSRNLFHWISPLKFWCNFLNNFMNWSIAELGYWFISEIFTQFAINIFIFNFFFQCIIYLAPHEIFFFFFRQYFHCQKIFSLRHSWVCIVLYDFDLDETSVTRAL